MFSSLDPENPYRIRADQIECEVRAVRDVSMLFGKKGEGRSIIAEAIGGKINIDTATEKIRDMLYRHADAISRSG